MVITSIYTVSLDIDETTTPSTPHHKNKNNIVFTQNLCVS